MLQAEVFRRPLWPFSLACPRNGFLDNFCSFAARFVDLAVPLCVETNAE